MGNPLTFRCQKAKADVLRLERHPGYEGGAVLYTETDNLEGHEGPMVFLSLEDTETLIAALQKVADEGRARLALREARQTRASRPNGCGWVNPNTP